MVFWQGLCCACSSDALDRMNNTKGKKLYIAVLNILACQSVIILHTNGVFWSHPSGRLWYTANFLETFFYPAVPIFFMISGATLLNYRQRYGTKEFLRRRFTKTGIPFLVWSMLACLFQSYVSKVPVDWNPLHIIDNIENTRYFSIYWFFIPLFSIYLTIPILSLIEDKMRMCRYAIVIGMIFVCILPLICSLLKFPFNGQLTPSVVTGDMIFVFLGYYLSNVQLTKKQRIILYVAGVLGWTMHFAGTIILFIGQTDINGTFKGYTNLPCVLHSIALFVLFRHIDYEKLINSFPLKLHDIDNHVEAFIYHLSEQTFGIYLIHFFLIIRIPFLLHLNVASMVWRLGWAVIIFWCCAGLTFIMKKVPVLREIVP